MPALCTLHTIPTSPRHVLACWVAGFAEISSWIDLKTAVTCSEQSTISCRLSILGQNQPAHPHKLESSLLESRSVGVLTVLAFVLFQTSQFSFCACFHIPSGRFRQSSVIATTLAHRTVAVLLGGSSVKISEERSMLFSICGASSTPSLAIAGLCQSPEILSYARTPTSFNSPRSTGPV